MLTVNYVLIFVGATIAFSGTAIAYREKSKDNLDKSKSNKWTNVSFIVASIGVIITVISGLYSEKGKKEEKVNRIATEQKYDSVNKLIVLKEDSIKHINEELRSTSDTVKRKTDYIIQLQKGQLDSSKYLLKRSLTTMSLLTKQYREITGYGNMPTVIYWAKKNRDINGNVLNTNEVVIGLKNESQYPLHGATTHITGIITKPNSYDFINREYQSYELAPGVTHYFFRENLNRTEEIWYGLSVQVYWSRGTFIAEITIDPNQTNETGYLKSTIRLHTESQKPLTPKTFMPQD